QTGVERFARMLDGVARVSYSPDGKYLASVTEGKSAQLWDAATGQEVADLKGDLLRFHCVTFSRDGRFLFAGGGDWNQGGVSQVLVWDVATRQQVGKLAGHTQPILAVTVSPDNKTIATGAVDN